MGGFVAIAMASHMVCVVSAPFTLASPSPPRASRNRQTQILAIRQQRPYSPRPFKLSEEPSSTGPVQTERAWDSGLLLGPSPVDSKWWDRFTFAGPVVTRDPFYQIRYSPYRMYYHGRAGDRWNMDVVPYDSSLPTGRIGLALSEDGIFMERFKGPLEGGAVIDPSSTPDAFDCVHLEVGDAFLRATNVSWYIYYSGAGIGDESVRRPHVGLIMSQEGVFVKQDERKGIVLRAGEPGSWDQNGIFCPRVLPPWEHGFPPGPLKGKWIMSYHTKEHGGPENLGIFSAGVAYSDDGIKWEKQGKVLAPGEAGSWDEAGICGRYIIRHFSDYLMFYEGRNYNNETGIGLAISGDGIEWEKDVKCGPEPGGPLLRPRQGDFWDNLVVGAPYVVPMFDGSLRIYYSGAGQREGDSAPKHGIGLAMCEKLDFRSWRRYSKDRPGPKEQKRGPPPLRLPKL